MSSPTQKSLALLRRQGWTVAVVERWNAHAKIRQDLFGFADLFAMQPKVYECANSTGGFVAVQACAAASNSARIAKVRAEPRARTFIESGGRIFVHSWAKRGKRGMRKVWQVNETEIFAEDIQPTVQP